MGRDIKPGGFHVPSSHEIPGGTWLPAAGCQSLLSILLPGAPFLYPVIFLLGSPKCLLYQAEKSRFLFDGLYLCGKRQAGTRERIVENDGPPGQ